MTMSRCVMYNLRNAGRAELYPRRSFENQFLKSCRFRQLLGNWALSVKADIAFRDTGDISSLRQADRQYPYDVCNLCIAELPPEQRGF